MKRVIVSSSGRPKFANSTRWDVKTIYIVIWSDQVVASEDSDPASEFFDRTIQSLIEADYLPYLGIELMRKKFHSPRSESEYYTFLKLEDGLKVKLILDIRFSSHDQTEDVNRPPSHNRHIDWQDQVLRNDIAEEGFDTSESELEFIDTRIKHKDFLEIDIDKVQTFSVDDALKVMKSKISNLP